MYTLLSFPPSVCSIIHLSVSPPAIKFTFSPGCNFNVVRYSGLVKIWYILLSAYWNIVDVPFIASFLPDTMPPSSSKKVAWDIGCCGTCGTFLPPSFAKIFADKIKNK